MDYRTSLKLYTDAMMSFLQRYKDDPATTFINEFEVLKNLKAQNDSYRRAYSPKNSMEIPDSLDKRMGYLDYMIETLPSKIERRRKKVTSDRAAADTEANLAYDELYLVVFEHERLVLHSMDAIFQMILDSGEGGGTPESWNKLEQLRTRINALRGELNDRRDVYQRKTPAARLDPLLLLPCETVLFYDDVAK